MHCGSQEEEEEEEAPHGSTHGISPGAEYFPGGWFTGAVRIRTGRVRTALGIRAAATAPSHSWNPGAARTRHRAGSILGVLPFGKRGQQLRCAAAPQGEQEQICYRVTQERRCCGNPGGDQDVVTESIKPVPQPLTPLGAILLCHLTSPTLLETDLPAKGRQPGAQDHVCTPVCGFGEASSLCLSLLPINPASRRAARTLI